MNKIIGKGGKIDLEALGTVIGGYLFFNEKKLLEVIDDKTGEVIKTFTNIQAARKEARKLKQSEIFIRLDELDDLRLNGSLS